MEGGISRHARSHQGDQTMTDIIDRLNDSLSAGYSELRKEAAVEIMRLRNDYYVLLQERDALRTKIAAMEKQEPVGWLRLYADGSNSEDFTDLPDVFERQRPLYALPGAKTQGEEK